MGLVTRPWSESPLRATAEPGEDSGRRARPEMGDETDESQRGPRPNVTLRVRRRREKGRSSGDEKGTQR